MKNKYFLIIFLLLLSSYSHAYITVGSDNNCDYFSIWEAYNDGETEIRVTAQLLYNDVLTINSYRTFKGGYNNCFDAENDTVGENKTVWTGENFRMPINIQSTDGVILRIENFEIREGQGSLTDPGVMVIANNSNVLITNSIIHSNQGVNGGAIKIEGANARLTMLDTRIYNNTSSGSGGAIFCDEGTFFLLGDSAIHDNTADLAGGGVLATNSCQAHIRSGDVEEGLAVQYGVYNNESVNCGGGIQARSDADLFMSGSTARPASVKYNHSTSSGGGVCLVGEGTSATISNSLIDYNTAELLGGGVYVTSGAGFEMSRLDDECWNNDICSSVSHNSVNEMNASAGAVYIDNSSTVNISQTVIAYNEASEAAAFKLYGTGLVVLEGNLFYGNRNSNPLLDSQNLINLNDGENTDLVFQYNTVADNDVSFVFNIRNNNFPQSLRVLNSIIWEDRDILYSSGAMAPNIFFDSNIVNETGSLQPFTHQFSLIEDPQFVDSNNQDYHIYTSSPAIDYCDEFYADSQHPDLNGNPRGVNNPDVSNVNGPYDAGAFESQNDDLIFKNGF